MRNLIFAVSIALALAGCSTIQAITGATITQAQLDTARNTYDGTFLNALNKYAKAPRCGPNETFLKNQCHDPLTLKKLRAVDKVVEQDFSAVQANLSAGNNSALINSWTILTNAIQSANSLAFSLGIS